MAQRLIDQLIAGRHALLVAAVLLTVGLWSYSQRLEFDQSIESLYAPQNERLQSFLRSRQTFGGDEFIVLAWKDPALFDKNDRLSAAADRDIRALAEQIRQLPGIEPTSLQHLAETLDVPFFSSRMRQFSEGLLVSASGETTAVVSRLKPNGPGVPPRAETFQALRQLAAAHQPPAVVVGEPLQVHDMFRYVEEDGETLGWTSSIALLAVILVFFRNVRWTLIPLLVVQITLVLTRSVLVLSGIRLSMVSSVMTSLTMVVAIATVMHLTLRFRELRRSLGPESALRESLVQLLRPVLWTTLTTAAGFGVLVTSSITPVVSFGITMALATLVVVVAIALIVPGGVLCFSIPTDPATAPAERVISQMLGWLSTAVARRPAPWVALSVLLTVVCSAGLFRLRLETDFSRNFREASPIVQALNFFEAELGGAGTWEVNFPAPATLDTEFIEKVRRLSASLRALEERSGSQRLTKVISLTDAVDLLPRQLWFSARQAMLDARKPDFTPSVYNPAKSRMRIMLRAPERQEAENKLALIAEVEAIARQEFPDAEAAGLFVLLAYLTDSLMSDQWTSLMLGAVAIVLLMAIAFRSWKIGFVTLLPNVFPILVVVGTLGLLNIPVNIATAMIASVSMGLTVDSSIHFLTGFREARARGHTFEDALRSTHQGVGLALMLANIALVIGFLVLARSHFIPLVYFGVLVSLALLGGLFGNLVLLPCLMLWIDKNPRQNELAPLERLRQPAAPPSHSAVPIEQLPVG